MKEANNIKLIDWNDGVIYAKEGTLLEMNKWLLKRLFYYDDKNGLEIQWLYNDEILVHKRNNGNDWVVIE